MQPVEVCDPVFLLLFAGVSRAPAPALPRLALIPSIEVLMADGWSIGISIIKPASGLMLQILSPRRDVASRATWDTV